MDKMRKIAGNGALMPRFNDGMANMAELIRVMTESLVNEIMDTRGDEARESCNRRNGYRERKLVTSIGTIDLRVPKLRAAATSPRVSSSGSRVWTARSSPLCPRWRPTACPSGRRSACRKA